MTKNNMKSDTKNPSKKEGLLVHVVVPAKADKDIISEIEDILIYSTKHISTYEPYMKNIIIDLNRTTDLIYKLIIRSEVNILNKAIENIDSIMDKPYYYKTSYDCISDIEDRLIELKKELK